MTKYKLLTKRKKKKIPDNLDYRVKDTFRMAALIQLCVGHQKRISLRIPLSVSEQTRSGKSIGD